MATGFNNGVYDNTKFSPPPSPDYYALSAASDVIVLDTAGTSNGENVIGVLFDTPTTTYTLSAVTLTSPDGTDTEIRCKLPAGTVIYTVTQSGFSVKYTLAETTTAPDLSGANLAVGPNFRRLRLLGIK